MPQKKWASFARAHTAEKVDRASFVVVKKKFGTIVGCQKDHSRRPNFADSAAHASTHVQLCDPPAHTGTTEPNGGHLSRHWPHQRIRCEWPASVRNILPRPPHHAYACAWPASHRAPRGRSCTERSLLIPSDEAGRTAAANCATIPRAARPRAAGRRRDRGAAAGAAGGVAAGVAAAAAGSAAAPS